MYRIFIRPVLFLFQPETIHAIVFSLLKFGAYIPGVPALLRALFSVKNTATQRLVSGISFPNPVGVAAGLDKNAEVFDMLGYLGFGFVEIGTVTPRAQAGNPKPRSFRLKKDNALINRMGFNNKGVDYAVEKLKKRKSDIIIGGNIGKNTSTPNQKAIDDYTYCFEKLYNYVDYFVVNVSCPNIKNLRKLQDKSHLTEILQTLNAIRKQKKEHKPVFLKISPDLTDKQIDEAVEIVKTTGIEGIVATNTTTGRNGLSYSETYMKEIGNGGLSGKPLRDRATEVIRHISEKPDGKIPIIGVGGIMNSADALEKLNAGADLVQLYTGFIYEGPVLPKKINQQILKNQKAT